MLKISFFQHVTLHILGRGTASPFHPQLAAASSTQSTMHPYASAHIGIGLGSVIGGARLAVHHHSGERACLPRNPQADFIETNPSRIGCRQPSDG